MSERKIIQAIRVLCDSAVADHSELGLYRGVLHTITTQSFEGFVGTTTAGSPTITNIVAGNLAHVPVGCKMKWTNFGSYGVYVYGTVISKGANSITLDINATLDGAGTASGELNVCVTGNPYICRILSTVNFSTSSVVQVIDGWGATYENIIEVGTTYIKLGSNATASVEETDTADIQIMGNSELRWSENILTGTALAWKSGIIAKGGIGKVKQSANCEQGGSPVNYDGFDVVAVNTNQLILRLQELGIKINGLKCEQWEFEGTEADSDYYSATVLATYNISDPSWNEKTINIPVRNNMYKRRAVLGTVINNDPINGNYKLAKDSKNGTITPITIGSFYPFSTQGDAEIPVETRAYAKLIRTSETESVFTNDLGTEDFEHSYLDPIGAFMFPIVGTVGSSPYLTYEIKLGKASHGLWYDTLLARLDELFVGKYIKITVGGSSDNTSFIGAYRKITDASIKTGDETVVVLTLDSFFEKDLSGNSTAEATNNAWCSILDVPFGFTVDTWTCIGFIDENGAALAAGDYPRLSVYNSDSTGQYTSKFSQDEEGVITEERSLVPVGFSIIPNYGYSSVIDALKNKLEIDLKLFKNDPNQLLTYSIFPVDNPRKLLLSNLNRYYPIDLLQATDTDSWYVDKSQTLTDLATVGAVSDMIDRDEDTAFSQTAKITTNVANVSIATAYACDIPKSKLLVNYDSYYLGVNYKSRVLSSGVLNRVVLKLYSERFMGILIPNSFNTIFDSYSLPYVDSIITLFTFSGTCVSGSPNIVTSLDNSDFAKVIVGSKVSITNFSSGEHTILSKSGTYPNNTVVIDSNATGTGACTATLIDIPEFFKIEDLPDFYYINRDTADNNKAFYFSQAYAEGQTGIGYHKTFHFTNFNSVNDINSIDKIVFVHVIETGNGAGIKLQFTRNMCELALICEKSYSIKDELYAYFKGRTIGDTWGGRKTAANQIITVAEFFEHVLRLQNWEETGDQVDWGHVYAPSAKIKTGTGEGSLDALPDELCDTTGEHYTPTIQIDDLDKSATDALGAMLCRRFHLGWYQDKDGNECIIDLATKTSPTTNVTFGDMIPGSIGSTIEPKAQNVFVNHFVSYCYNPGSRKFDKELRVLNASDSTFTKPDGTTHTAGSGWEPDLTPGFQDTDGQEVWEACNALWKKFRQIEQPPASMTDLECITTYRDALSIIKKQVAWMDKRRDTFSVPYTFASSDNVRARDWHIFQHINIMHPHKTDGEYIECVIESIEKDKRGNAIRVQVILLDEIPTAFFLT